MMTASGFRIGSRNRIASSSMRQKETTGAPMRSEPKLGNACACLAFQESGDGQHFGCGDHALPSATMYADLKHSSSS